MVKIVYSCFGCNNRDDWNFDFYEITFDNCKSIFLCSKCYNNLFKKIKEGYNGCVSNEFR
jgi:hypothetical protein